MAKNEDVDLISNGINRICAGTEIKGNINASSDIRIDGVLEGDLVTKGKLVVGQTGRINGNIECKNADILGNVDGKLNVAELLALKPTARLTGEILIGKLLIEVGATFVGNCNMTGANNTTAQKK